MQIRFSHIYPKIWGQTSAELVHINILDAEKVNNVPKLIEYDTMFEEGSDVGYYSLPKKGKLIQLIFVGNYNIPFCTLRRFTLEKLDYYSRTMGKIFYIVIKKERT